MQLHRLVIDWSGGSVKGKAVTVLHFDGTEQPAPPVAAVKAAFQAAANRFQGGVTLTFPSSGDTIDDTTGDLVGSWTSADGGQVTTTGDPNAAGGVGACIGWTTGGIVSGTKGPRRLRGRTFLVPLHAGCYQADGTLDTAVLASLQTLADAIRGAGGLAVWHRPSTATSSDGTSYGVLSARVRDHVAFLSSRRD